MNLTDYIASIPDYPKEGILFRDVTPLMADGAAFKYACEQFTEYAKEKGAEVDVITAAEFGTDAVSNYDAFAFGCPAMGDEVLEEDEFQPMWDSVKDSLGGKKTVLFGSYGWGDGEWMRNWEEDAKAAGVNLAADVLIANEAPDDDAVESCKALGAAIA